MRITHGLRASAAAGTVLAAGSTITPAPWWLWAAWAVGTLVAAVQSLMSA